MEIAPLVIAAALVLKLVDFAKYLRAGETNAYLTQLAVWVSSVGVAFLLRASDFADGISIGAGLTLATVNPASAVLVGLALGSTASTAYDAKRAFDNNDSAKTPELFNTGK